MRDGLVLLRIAGLGIAVAVLVTLLKQMGRDDQAQMVTLVGLLLVLSLVVTYMSELVSAVSYVFLLR